MTTDMALPMEKETTDNTISVQELQVVKDVITSFLTAFKNYGLYPEEHETSKKFLANIKTNLETFLNAHHNLRFQVEKERLLYKTETIHQGPASDENFAFLLYRDGIKWIEFQKNLEQKEITSLLKILNHYRILQDDPEGDIVTALWESEFPHIRYEASDDLWMSEPLLDFSQLNVDGRESLEQEQSEEQQSQEEEEDTEEGNEKSEGQKGGIPLSIAAQSADSSLWELSPQEMAALEQLIREDKNRDTITDTLDLLMIILKEEDDKENLTDILSFLKDEFKDILKQQEFHFAVEFLKSIYGFYRYCKAEKKWFLPPFVAFIRSISSSQTLASLLPTLQTINTLEESQKAFLSKLLVSMQPLAIEALSPMLSEISSEQNRDFLITIITALAKKDMSPLESLMDSDDEMMVQRIIPVLGQLGSPKTIDLLLNKLLCHENDRIRHEALRAIIRKNYQDFKKLYFLIDDSSEKIRYLFLQYMGQNRSTVNEDFLRQYLEKQEHRVKTDDHILACYRALGRCGSERSVPYLRRTLLNWSGGLLALGSTAHQQGAALALKTLGTENSKAALEEASKSLVPNIRKAYRRAIEE